MKFERIYVQLYHTKHQSVFFLHYCSQRSMQGFFHSYNKLNVSHSSGQRTQTRNSVSFRDVSSSSLAVGWIVRVIRDRWRPAIFLHHFILHFSELDDVSAVWWEHAVDWNAHQAHGGGEKRQNQDFSKNHDDIVPNEKKNRFNFKSCFRPQTRICSC